MAKLAKDIIALAQSWLGKNNKDGSHKMIIDIYNSHKPLARGYKVKYTDAYCATTIAALSIALEYTDIIPTECGCQEMINLFKQMSCWVENENRTPNAGDIIFYDWQDNGVGDNTGWSDHVGIVESVSNGKITVIEGNYSGAVKRRTLDVNARYIRGYGVPRYDKEVVVKAEKEGVKYKMNTLKRGSTGNHVTIFETLMKEMGLYTGKIDTEFGPKCEAAANSFMEKYPECGTNGKPDNTWGPKCWNKVFTLFGA